MVRAARTDGIHAEVRDTLRKLGCRVADTSRAGNGFPDLVVRLPNGTIRLVEIKQPKGALKPSQVRFCEAWPETQIVRSVEDALRLVFTS